jgi:Zn-dependent protease
MKCEKCGVETYIPFECPYCGGRFCSVHRLPEKHDCPGVEAVRASRFVQPEPMAPASTYEYKVTFGGYPPRVNRVFFSMKEVGHLLVAGVLVLCVGFSIFWYEGYSLENSWILLTLLSLLLTISFLTHEVAHKIVAQRKGLWAEFRLTLWGVALTLFSVISPLKIVSPGAVMISGYAQKSDIGRISIAGPATNLLFAFLFIGASVLFPYYVDIFLWVAYINALIATLNLIPFSILDGHKIFDWNKKLWGISFAVSIVLTAAMLFTV